MNRPSYATVEQILSASDFKRSAHLTPRILRLARSASRLVDDLTRRHFYPITQTKTFNYPRPSSPDGYGAGFWLDGDLLVLDAITIDGVSKDPTAYDLYPSTAPYSWIGATGTTITVTGDWGATDDLEAAGTLAAALSDTTGTSVTVSDSSKVGIGDLLTVGTERLLVTEKSDVDTTEDLAAGLSALESDNTVAVSDGSAFRAGEEVLVGSERFLIVAIAANDLIVRRAWSGSVLAAHSSGADIWAPRSLTVERGATGSTAATHLSGAPVWRNRPPGPVVDLTIAEALTTFEQETAGYGRVVGSGDNQQEAAGAGIESIRRQVRRYRRTRQVGL